MRRFTTLCFAILFCSSLFAQKNEWTKLDSSHTRFFKESKKSDWNYIHFDKHKYKNYYYFSPSNNWAVTGYSINTILDKGPHVFTNRYDIPAGEKFGVRTLNILNTYDPMRSIILAMLKYDHNKMLFGSYKHFTPDYSYYQLWQNMLTAKYPQFRSIKDKDSLYKIALDSFVGFYEKHFATIQNYKYAAEFHYMGKNDPREFTDFNFPQFINNDEVLTIKNTYYDNPRLIRIDANAEEHKMADASAFWDMYFAYRNKKIYWSEKQIKDNGDLYGHIYVYDMERKRTEKLTRNKLYRFPNPSEEGYYIVAVRGGGTHDYLCQLDAKSGVEETVIDSLYKYSYPCYTYDSKDVYVVATDTNGRNAMIKINVKSGAKTMIVDFTYHHISSIHVGRKFLYFDASFSGLNNIYCFDLYQKKVVTVTNRLSGCYHAASNESEDKLLFTEYTHVGKNLMVVNVIEFDKWRKVDKILDIPEFRPYYYNWLEPYRNVMSASKKKDTIASPNELKYYECLMVAQRPTGSIYYIKNNILNKTSFYGGLDINRSELFVSPTIGCSKQFNRFELGAKYNYIYSRWSPFDGLVPNTHDLSLLFHTWQNSFNRGSFVAHDWMLRPGYNLNEKNNFPYLFLAGSAKRYSPITKGNIYSNQARSLGVDFFQNLGNSGNGSRRYHIYGEAIQKVSAKSHLIAKLGYMYNQHNVGLTYYTNYMLNRGNYQMLFRHAAYLNLEYAFPLAFIDYSYKKSLYIKAIRASIFADGAFVKQGKATAINNSQGIEVFAECYLNRAIKLNLGLRVARVQNLGSRPNVFVVQPIMPNVVTNL